MCGIACIISCKIQSERENSIEKLLSGITHRGRDDAGITSVNFAKYDVGITLGHRRLSVIDLETRANQPFISECGKVIISFNGEIYNYKQLREKIIAQGYNLVTESDTEVIVVGYKCFGLKIFDMLEGMFAFVLLSILENAVYIARDYFGVKPVYYHESDKSIIICSESRAISQLVTAHPDIDKLRAVISFGYNVGFPSVYNGVKKIPKGMVLKYNLESSSWSSSFPIAINYAHEIVLATTIVQSVECDLKRSLEAQTVSDIGFGVFLSGGIDSGLIASILHQQGHFFPVFTAGNINELGSDASRAKILTDQLKLPIFNFDINVANIPELMLNTYSSLTEPILDSSLIYSNVLSKLASNEDIKVILSGAGGDELFFGYSRYSATNLSRLLFRIIPLSVRRLLSKIVFSMPLKNRLRFPSLDFAMQIAGSVSAIKNVPLSYLETDDFKEFDDEYSTSIECQNRFDMDVYLTENILLGFDQSTMMHTVEGRVPFLDRKLYRITRGITSQDHMSGGRLKSVLRDIAINHLPSEYLTAPKQGFSGPVSTWVNGNEKYFNDYAVRALKLINGTSAKVTSNKLIKKLNCYDKFNLTALQIWNENN